MQALQFSTWGPGGPEWARRLTRIRVQGRSGLRCVRPA